MKKILFIVAILLLLSISIFFVFISYYRNQPVEAEIYSMNTVIDLKIWGVDKNRVLKQIEAEINKLNLLFDDFNPNSEISKINENASISSVKVSQDTLSILLKSKEMYYKTKGAFNITIAPVLQIWGFKNQEYRIPSPNEIKEALSLSNINDLVIQGDEVYLKKKGERIDLGGIAKGYALDKIKEIIENSKTKKAIINMGGNVFVYSIDPNEVFKIGIKHPRESSVIAVLEVKSGTFVSTSGDYERYFELNGKRYCHIIDPSTGYPADVVFSATAITKSGYVGDALSTAFFVLGKDETMKLSDELGVSYVIVSKDLSVSYSKDLSQVITIENR